MKLLRLFSAAAALGAVGARAAVIDKPAVETPVTVTWDHPEKFADVKDSMLGTDEGRDAILATLKTFIVGRATDALPPGYHLSMTFTDIHLAGDFEPWRGARWNDVRVIRDIYPPAFRFSWAVTSPSGAIVRKGDEFIRDMGFQFRAIMDTSDPLRYEKDILKDWISTNLRNLPKT